MVSRYKKSIQPRPVTEAYPELMALDALQKRALGILKEMNPVKRVAPLERKLTLEPVRVRHIVRRKVELKGGFYVERDYVI